MSHSHAPAPGSEPTGEEAGDALANVRHRIANSSVWSLLLGGRRLPFRETDAFRALEVSRLPDGTGLRVSGELDVLSVLKLEEAIAGADLPVPLVLDFSGVTFMDGVGVSLLLRLARMDGGVERVVLRNPSRSVRRVLAIAIPAGEPGLCVRFD
jgi:anti-anti-sigma factor